MIPNDIPQQLEVSGNDITSVTQYRITEANQARILVSLSDKMYTRKELAVIREYSNNANDAHIVVGKPTSDIIVTLPTYENLSFKVRDFGHGLSKEQIRDIYCVLGESTKRNSQEQNGVLGYGCKSGFAISDSFTVTSWYNGEKTVYNCIKGDVIKLPSIIELSRCPSDEPSGIEICIPINQNNIYTFQLEAANFFKYWDTLPTFVNLFDSYNELITKFKNTSPLLSGDNWEIYPATEVTATAHAVMGNVPYRIDWYMLSANMSLRETERIIFDILKQNDVVIKFKMGELQFVDSREGLEYTERTINSLKSVFDNICNSIINVIQQKIDNATNIWDAKIIYDSIFNISKLKFKDDDDEHDDKNDISFLKGNLQNLELKLRGKFHWNQIPIFNCGFDNVNRFDNNDTSKMFNNSHRPIKPVLSIYRKGNGKVKSMYDNCIYANKYAKVIINNTGKTTNNSLVARHIMFNTESNVKIVYILTFNDDTIKQNFYNECTFDTVPTLDYSTILSEARQWKRLNQTNTYSKTSSKTFHCICLKTKTTYNVALTQDELNSGGFFISPSTTGNNKVLLFGGYHNLSYDQFINQLNTVTSIFNINTDKIYVVDNKTQKYAWFSKLVNNKKWHNILSYMFNNIENIKNSDKIPLIYNIVWNRIFPDSSLNDILNHIPDKNNYLYALKSKYDEIAKYKDIVNVVYVFDIFKILIQNNSNSESKELRKLQDDIINKYPLIIKYKNSLLSDTEVLNLATYINAMDCYINMCSENSEYNKSLTTK